MIEAHEVQNGGVEIVDVDGPLDGAQAVLVGGTVDDAALYARAREPRAEGPRMMLAALRVGGVVERRAAKLGGPHDERVVEHSALLEVAQQGGDGLVHVFGESLVGQHVAVRIPVAGRAGVDEFDKAHAAFHEPARGETLPAEAGGLAALQAVAREGRRILGLEIERVGHGHLHAERGLERTQARGEQRVGIARDEVGFIQRLQRGELERLATGGRARRDVGDRLRAGHDERSLMRAGEEVVRIDLRARVGLLGRDDHEGRQIAVHRAQPVAHPRPEARAREGERAGVHAERGVVMIRVRGVQRADERELVHARRDVREQRADLGAALPVPRELPLRALEKNALVAGAVLDFGMVGLDLLAVIAREGGLGIEGVHVRDAAGHEQKNHALGLGGKLRRERRERITAVGEQLPHDAGKQQRTSDGGLEETAAGEGAGRRGFHECARWGFWWRGLLFIGVSDGI